MKYTVMKAFLFMICSFFIVAAPFIYFPDEKAVLASSFSVGENSTIILDAGHGGEDGGAIGAGGIIEKDLNLSITLKTEKLFSLFGYDTVLTRKTDTMTCDEGLFSQREKKVSDIKNRLSLLEKTPCLCFVSIHQNIFGGDAHGAQVFYGGKNPGSKALATALQSGISDLLQPENHRSVKESSKDIYILYNAQKPAVLVECGFISNSAEAAMLTDENYQSEMAFAIALSSIKHLTEREV